MKYFTHPYILIANKFAEYIKLRFSDNGISNHVEKSLKLMLTENVVIQNYAYRPRPIKVIDFHNFCKSQFNKSIGKFIATIDTFKYLVVRYKTLCKTPARHISDIADTFPQGSVSVAFDISLTNSRKWVPLISPHKLSNALLSGIFQSQMLLFSNKARIGSADSIRQVAGIAVSLNRFKSCVIGTIVLCPLYFKLAMAWSIHAKKTPILSRCLQLFLRRVRAVWGFPEYLCDQFRNGYSNPFACFWFFFKSILHVFFTCDDEISPSIQHNLNRKNTNQMLVDLMKNNAMAEGRRNRVEAA